MKIKDLVNILAKYDPNMEVVVSAEDVGCGCYTTAAGVSKITLGSMGDDIFQEDLDDDDLTDEGSTKNKEYICIL